MYRFVNLFAPNRPSSAAIWFAVVFMAQPVRAEQQSADLLAVYERLSNEFAAACPGWRPQPPQTGALVFVASNQYSAADEEGNEYRAARTKYAEELFELAKKAVRAGQLSLAFQWATEVLREIPDHAEARRILGYENRDGQWLTVYGARMVDSGKVWHPKFGWIAAADRPRYESGERLVGTRWMSAEDDAARRRDIKNGWQVRTDHFLVTTNHSLEAAAELAARLERLHQVWRQLFAGFYLSEKEVRGLFAGDRQPRRQVRPFRVYYHRDRDEYAAALVRRQPRIGETLGIYFDADRQAHFFAGTDADLGTLYHEAVHQLFQESKPAAKQIGNLANFWIVEGVATYFETLAEHLDASAGLYYTIGERAAGRLPAARERLVDGFYVPLAELTRLGKNDLQQHAELPKLYSQSAGLAAFLMDGQQGRYREPLVRYLEAVYTGRDSTQSLADITSVGYDELDAQYHGYMQSLP
ncbi:MAG: hypothetical protein WD738_02320 [Pirellulales bacterium]